MSVKQELTISCDKNKKILDLSLHAILLPVFQAVQFTKVDG